MSIKQMVFDHMLYTFAILLTYINIGEYTDLYFKSDVLLLTNIFENFRNLYMSAYNLDRAWYYTTAGLSWDAMPKITKVSLDLFSDSDMLFLVRKGIRGENLNVTITMAKQTINICQSLSKKIHHINCYT